MNPDLRARLEEAGVDPDVISDPWQAWLRLFDQFGLRATLIDRYELESAFMGIPVEGLPVEDRQRMTLEVVHVRYPGLELLGPPSWQPVIVVPYQDSWPELFASWRGTLSVVLSETAVRIDHVGSTAVPGLAAKPVIDIQVSVREVEDEAAYVPAISSTGVALRSREPDHRYFRPPLDQPRMVQIHVCAAGGMWERDHVLFRDFLRARRDVAAAYGALKVDLAERYREDRLAYNEAKTGFVLDSLETARRWAEQTGWSI